MSELESYIFFAYENWQICWAYLSGNFERLAHSWNTEVELLGCYLRDVAADLFAIIKAPLKSEIDALRFTRCAR
jgi:hypothetical protein